MLSACDPYEESVERIEGEHPLPYVVVVVEQMSDALPPSSPELDADTRVGLDVLHVRGFSWVSRYQPKGFANTPAANRYLARFAGPPARRFDDSPSWDPSHEPPAKGIAKGLLEPSLAIVGNEALEQSASVVHRQNPGHNVPQDNHSIMLYNPMIMPQAPEYPPTRERLMTAGLRLFAERGFRETTVGEIEAAAGLQPRRGALYNHFPSKQALLEAALQDYVKSIELGLSELEGLSGNDVEAEALSMGRWCLAEIDAAYYLFRIAEQDGDRLPGIRDLIRERVINAGHREVEKLLSRRLGTVSGLDTEALAALIVGPLANQRRVTWTFGEPPLGLDDERLLKAWSQSLAVLAQIAAPGRPTARGRRSATRTRSA